MGAITSEIISPTIVFSTVYLDTDQGKKSKLRVTGHCAGNSPEAGVLYDVKGFMKTHTGLTFIYLTCSLSIGQSVYDILKVIHLAL